MTRLSVNLNKIALLRNSRGRDFPNVVDFAKKMIALGVQGITVHPRPDERHIKKFDAIELGELLVNYPTVELNIEGYPSQDFMELVNRIKPDQCTLVPDSPHQLTSDHGWDLDKDGHSVQEICSQLSRSGIRSSLFIDPNPNQIRRVPMTGANRIELYTEKYASTFNTPEHQTVFEQYKVSADVANDEGLGVNAGHDLDSNNLAKFLTINDIREVSIGHVLTIECIEHGMNSVIGKYMDICESLS